MFTGETGADHRNSDIELVDIKQGGSSKWSSELRDGGDAGKGA
jgi:hypothetical protein